MAETKALPGSFPIPVTPPRVWMVRGAVAAAVLGYLAWSAVVLELKPLDLYTYRQNMAEYARGFMRPSFAEWRIYLEQMAITIHIAVWGTALSVLAAVPLGLLSSSNIVPVWVYQPTRRLMDAARSINEMIFAMLFIAAVGLGPFAGVLALFVHTAGTLAKLFSEAVEAIDPRPVEGIRATGSNLVEDIAFGVIPQVLPLWVSYSLYRFEANVRSASVVGMVGAGGIGVIIYEVIRGFEYAQTSAVMLMIIVFVTAIDMASALIRKMFI
jgi:phosphonate transport system permease protein